jgi:hypothetical protein
MLASLALAASVQAVNVTSVCYKQGPTRTGGVVAANRSDINKALVAQVSDAGALNFFSLGYGGWAILETDCPILNNNGTEADFSVIETTWGNPAQYPSGERARVYASQDGNNFVDLGGAIYNTAFDLGGLSWAKYFMVVDATPLENSEDAYDLDGLTFVEAGLPGVFPTPDASLGSNLVQYIGGMQGKQKGGANVPAIRSNPAKGLGAPQLNDTYNFYSLGFGGTAEYRFAYGVLDLAGADIQLVETSFGSPACNRYPENVKVSVSYDGNTWYDKGNLCLDGTIDVAPHMGVTYVRFTDVSDKARFNNSADGWDLDGAINLSSVDNGGSPCQAPARQVIAVADQNNVPDELQALQVIGETAVFSMAADQATVRITDNLGRVVASEVINGKIWDSVEFNLPSLKSGVYMMTVETAVSRDVIKFVK